MTILTAGILATLQDLGRPNWLAYGVPSGGAADTLRHRLANYLLGNAANAATLEITGGGWSAQIEEGAWLGFVGSGGQLWINGVAVPAGRAMYVPAGARLDVKRGADGVFSYLATSGGWQAPLVLGSASTCLVAGFGGMDGRALRAGDRLDAWQKVDKHINTKLWISPRFVRPDVFYTPGPPPAIRVLPGPEWDDWTADQHKTFLQTDWIVSPQSNRMGLRLQGDALPCRTGADMLSTGVAVGTVQVPPDGQPLVLLADAQTTGGYPRIAQVIAADLPKMAQRPVGASVRFEICDLDEAERWFFVQEKQVARVRIALEAAISKKAKLQKANRQCR